MPSDRPWTTFQTRPKTGDGETVADADREDTRIDRYGVPEAPNGLPLVPGKPDGCVIS